MKHYFLTLFFGFSVNLLISQLDITAVIEGYKKDKDLQHAQYSFCIMEASTGNILKEYNAEIALIPASTMKIITTSAALGILGKDFTYKTNYNVLYNSDIIEKATETKLYVDGSGDPSFNSSYFY